MSASASPPTCRGVSEPLICAGGMDGVLPPKRDGKPPVGGILRQSERVGGFLLFRPEEDVTKAGPLRDLGVSRLHVGIRGVRIVRGAGRASRQHFSGSMDPIRSVRQKIHRRGTVSHTGRWPWAVPGVRASPGYLSPSRAQESVRCPSHLRRVGVAAARDAPEDGLCTPSRERSAQS